MESLGLVLPLLIAVMTGVFVWVLSVWQRDEEGSRDYLAWVSITGLGIAAIHTLYLLSNEVRMFALGSRLMVDGLSQTLNLLILFGTMVTCGLSPSYLASHRKARGEYYALLLLSCSGMMLMTSGVDLFVLFLGAVLTMLPLCGLVGFFDHSSRSSEGALKMFLLSSLAGLVMLYGVALIYGATGTTSLEGIAVALKVGQTSGVLETAGVTTEGAQLYRLTMMPAAGLVMVLAGLSFMMTLAPFHMWAPDSFQGAPSSLGGFLSATVKIAALAALLRVVTWGFSGQPARLGPTGWLTVLFWLSLVSMVYGSLAAILQKNIKRMLAYLAIAHGGYLVMGMLSAAWSKATMTSGLAVLMLYMLVFMLAMMGVYGSLAYLGRRGEECQTLEDVSGIWHRHPGVSFAMIVAVLSIAGAPLTGGFVARLHLLKSAMETGESAYLWLVVVCALTSVVGAYCCLKVVMAIVMKTSRREVRTVGGRTLGGVLVICTVLTLGLGLYPTPIVKLLNHGAAEMFWPSATQEGGLITGAAALDSSVAVSIDVKVEQMR